MQALVEQNARLVSAQSTPLLTLETGNLEDGKPAISMTLRNVGTGPAHIAWFRVVDADGTDYRGGPLYERVSKVDPGARFTSVPISGTLMRSGDDRVVFDWPKPTVAAAFVEWEKLNKTRFGLRASACYCSIFDECKITEFGDSRPKPVAACDRGSGE